MHGNPEREKQRQREEGHEGIESVERCGPQARA